jgi:proline iminopeptidase
VTAARDRYLAFRRALPPLPPLIRQRVAARGLDFAVFRTAPPDTATQPPLLCINGGLLFSHALLWPMLSPLAEQRMLILYDQRGRGESAAPPGVRAARIEHDGSDVVALVEALALDQVDLLGHSWGGGIAMLAASALTTRVRRLVLANAVGITSAWLPPLHDIAVARLSGPARDALAALDPQQLVEPELAMHARYARAFYPAWFADRAFGRQVTPPPGTSQTGAVIAARLRRDGYDWHETVRALTARTLVLHGTDDALPVATALDTADHLGRVTSVTTSLIAGAGHMPFLEQPAPFFAQVEAFLGDA